MISALTISLLGLAAPESQGPVTVGEPWPTIEIRRWYGGELIVADLTSALTLSIGVASRLEPLFYTGIATWSLGVPVIHGLHGQTPKVFASLGLRLATPLLGIGLGDRLSRGDTTGVLVGAVVGMLLATVIDDFFLASEVVEVRGLQPAPLEPPGAGRPDPGGGP